MFYLFVGEKATTGNPHPITGRHSQYGSIYAFNDKASRDKAADHFERRGRHRLVVKGGKAKMRQFCLGMSVLEFGELLENYSVDAGNDVKSCIN